MSQAYELLQKTAESSKQIYTLLRFACKCDDVTGLTMNNWESVGVFLSAKNKNIKIHSLMEIDDNIKTTFNPIADEIGVNLKFNTMPDVLVPTELLYINTPEEGNFRLQELTKYSGQVSKYIILPNTQKFAHTPSAQIKLANNMTPIGLVFGINHWLQNNDDWFILEHDDVDPGMTVLVNRKNVTNGVQ